jgi:hypothetical protein
MKASEFIIEKKHQKPKLSQTNPVARNAMATVGGGGFGSHKDKKAAMKRGEEKHKKNYAMAEDMSINDLAMISDEALDKAYGYGRSSPGNTFGWQANLKSAEFAKKIIDAGIEDIEKISDAIHKGWNVTANAFVQNPEQFDDTEKLKAAGKLEAKIQQRAKLMKKNYDQLPEEEKEKDRVVARALLKAIKGVKEGDEWNSNDWSSSSKSDFKRRELEWELRHEKNLPKSSFQSSGMYFYNVKAGQESKAVNLGLRKTKSGRWYSKSKNSQADTEFGPGKFWQPKS